MINYFNTVKKSKNCVLIVDDQKINREILKTILMPEFDTLEAENGLQAFDVLKDHKVSAILLDIIMPVMDGFTFLEKLKKSFYSSIPTIALTAEKDSKTEEKALDLGAWDFVPKPYQPLILKTRINNVIVRSQYYLLDEMKNIFEHDSLTGLYNRQQFFLKGRAFLDDNKTKRFYLIRFDINHFSTFNTFWGEDEGDKLLRLIANAFTDFTKECETCVVARFTADVFVVLAPLNRESISLII
jgi:PleD family two-component response regulator